jgi:hypothetical protein
LPERRNAFRQNAIYSSSAYRRPRQAEALFLSKVWRLIQTVSELAHHLGNVVWLANRFQRRRVGELRDLFVAFIVQEQPGGPDATAFAAMPRPRNSFARPQVMVTSDRWER